jgi:hypothetical protein
LRARKREVSAPGRRDLADLQPNGYFDWREVRRLPRSAVRSGGSMSEPPASAPVVAPSATHVRHCSDSAGIQSRSRTTRRGLLANLYSTVLFVYGRPSQIVPLQDPPSSRRIVRNHSWDWRVRHT